MLTSILTQKFGQLPAGHREEIEKADSNAIHRWVEVALNAESIDQVFNGNGR